MQRNVDLNFPQYVAAEDNLDTCPVKVAELNWGGELPEGVPHEPEIILAADCVYFEVGLRDSLQMSPGLSLTHIRSLRFPYWWTRCVI